MSKKKITQVLAKTDGETVKIKTEKEIMKNRIFGTINTWFGNYDKDENARLKIKSLYRLLQNS